MFIILCHLLLYNRAFSPPPSHLQLFADCLTIVTASKFGANFSPEIQATWQKFLAVVVAALSSRYF